MKNRFILTCSTTAIAALAGASLLGPAQALAGPGCMNKPRTMAWHPYPHSPMGPYAGGWASQQPYQRGARAPMPVASPYSRPLSAEIRPAPKTAKPATQQMIVEDAPVGEAVTVRIKEMRFEPASIRIKPGTTVTWVQDDRMPHTITGKNGLRSETLYSGQRYSHTFDASGAHDYVCSFHPSMQGLVIVEQSEADS